MTDDRFDEDAPLLDGGERLPPELFRSLEPSTEFREQLLVQTAAHVRRHARGRRFLLAGAVAASYLIGVGSGFWARPVQRGAAMTSNPPFHASVDVTAALPVPETEAPSLPVLRDPEALAQKLAKLPPNKRAEFLKLAGDRYLTDLNEMSLALSCYRQMLDKLPIEEIAKPQPNDTWLLSMLKQARTNEVSHEKPKA